MFSSASITVNRGSAPKNVPVSPDDRFKSISSTSPLSCASACARLTAIVVAPTPPLAPTIAKTLPPLGAACCSRRLIADSTLSCVTGSGTHSFTPARIASSINAGSSDEQMIAIPIDG